LPLAVIMEDLQAKSFSKSYYFGIEHVVDNHGFNSYSSFRLLTGADSLDSPFCEMKKATLCCEGVAWLSETQFVGATYQNLLLGALLSSGGLTASGNRSELFGPSFRCKGNCLVLDVDRDLVELCKEVQAKNAVDLLLVSRKDL
jgi:hypothetical protein